VGCFTGSRLSYEVRTKRHRDLDPAGGLFLSRTEFENNRWLPDHTCHGTISRIRQLLRPWIGIDLRFKAREIKTFAHRFETYFTYEYHWADFDAEADWNLRDDFAHPKSFKHDTDGNGYVIGAGFNFVLHQHWALNFNFDYQDWSTDDGTIKFFLADGTTHKQQLNEVNWTSYALSLGLSVRF
jgi:hypothetical protein